MAFYPLVLTIKKPEANLVIHLASRIMKPSIQISSLAHPVAQRIGIDYMRYIWQKLWIQTHFQMVLPYWILAHRLHFKLSCYDHDRLYSKNGFISRVEEAGFSLKQCGAEHFGTDVFAECGISPRSVLYVLLKHEGSLLA
jgi:hypothetical protein